MVYSIGESRLPAVSNTPANNTDMLAPVVHQKLVLCVSLEQKALAGYTDILVLPSHADVQEVMLNAHPQLSKFRLRTCVSPVVH